jgi:hypothetical protein
LQHCSQWPSYGNNPDTTDEWIKKIYIYTIEFIQPEGRMKPCDLKVNGCRAIPRWRLEGGSRKHASYSEMLEKRWRHTLQARPLRRDKTLTPPYLQPVQRISTSH